MQVLTNQEFTYRESPAEQDGYGKLKVLYGNTMVWNQQIPIPTRQSGASNGITVTNNSDGSLTLNGTPSDRNINWWIWGDYATNVSILSLKASHKYFVKDCNLYRETGGSLLTQYIGANPVIWSPSADYELGGVRVANGDTSKTYTNVKVYPMIIDLTQMGLDITDPSEFTLLFPKPYYDYCQGAMLSFGGRNVKFNQLVQNGNFESISGWEVVRGTPTASNNVLSYRVDVLGGGGLQNRIVQNISIPANHKVFYSLNINPPKAFSVIMNIGIEFVDKATTVPNTWNLCKGIRTLSSAMTDFRFGCPSTVGNMAVGDVIQFKNVMLVDLTEMFGAGNEPSVEGFRELFPNDYYDYTIGQYMNIGQPVSLKTVGKNQFDTQVVTTSYQGLTLTKTQGTIRAVYSGGSRYAGFNFYGAPVFTETFLKGKYRLSFDVKGLDTQWTVGLRQGASFVGGGQAIAFSNNGHHSFTIDAEANPNCYFSFARTGNKTTAYDVTFSNIQLELGTTETSYTPFEEKTISLPISTYFPTGMKSAGTVYDELLPTKAITRVGAVDLGSLTWSYNSARRNFYANISDLKPIDIRSVGNGICPLYTGVTFGSMYGDVAPDKSFAFWDSDGRIYIKDLAYTETPAFKQAMSGVYLCYELSTPLENYGVVDLGTLNWSVSNGVSPMRFQADMPSGYKKPTTSSERNRLICSKYITNSAVTGSNNETGITNYQGLNVVFVRDLTYADVASFKQAMQGVYLLYEKVNPQGLVYPPQSKEEYPFFKSYKGGTEQLLPENGSVPVTAPILADMNYSSGAIEVTTYPNPEQGGETSGDGWYLVGEEATVNATPNEHYAFNNWVLDGEIVSTDPEYTFEAQDE